MSKALLLIKAGRRFKNAPGFVFLNHRWQRIDKGKKHPKSALTAKHLSGVGTFVPKQHFTDDEWEQLKETKSPTNAKTFNNKLSQLRAFSDKGNVAAILASSYGINTYGKKLANIANKLLEMYGVEHKVKPGQKAGEHPALHVQAPPDAVEPPAVEVETDGQLPDKPELGPVGQALKEAISKPESATDKETLVVEPESAYGKGDKFKFSTALAKVNSGTWEVYNTSGDLIHLKKVGAKVPNSSNTVNIPKATLDQAVAAGTAAKVGADGELTSKLKTTDDYLPAKPPARGLDMPAFVEGKTTTGVVDYYTKQAQKILDMAAAGDVEGLEAMKAAGLKPNAKGKISNTFKGKTENSKTLLALHAQAVEHAKGGTAADQPAASSHAVPALAALVSEANSQDQSHTVSLADAKTGAMQPTLTKKVFKGENPVWFSQSSAGQIAFSGSAKVNGQEPEEWAKNHLAQFKAAKAAGYSYVNYKVSGYQHAYVFEKDGQILTKKGMAALLAGNAAEEQKVEPSQTTVKDEKPAGATAQAPAQPSAGSAPTGKASAEAKAMLDRIPWDSKLTVSEVKKNGDPLKEGINTNKKIAQIKALAYAGDLAALEAWPKAGVNTYGKKINDALALTIAALKEGGTGGNSAQAAPEAPAPAPETQQTPEPEAGKQSASQADDGPKDGDTKPAADGGTLVFKNGRWHKVDTGEAAAASSAAEDEHPVDAIPIPDLSKLKNPQIVLDALTALKDKVKTDGSAALKGTTKHMKASGKLITTLDVIHNGVSKKLKVTGYVGADRSAHNKVFEYVQALKQAATGKPATKAPAQPTPKPALGTPEAMDSWTQTGGQGGSNPGGKFRDPDGVEWYCKFPDNEDHAKAELLSASLYQLAGISAQDAKLVTRGGKLGIASRWVDLTKADPDKLAALDGAQSGLAVDAWLGNWDVVGMAFDNLQVGPDGKAHRVDAGGSLMFRAQGGKKAFGDAVTEIDTLRDKSINPQSAAVFGGMTKADITASVAKVASISDQNIRKLVDSLGPGDAAAKKALADTLIARKEDLLAKYPKAAKKTKAKAVFKVENLTEPPNFMDWNGGGKGLSSHQNINEANQAAVDAVYLSAQAGDLTTIRNVQAPVFDKNTGSILKHVPLSEHPSQHVRAYWQNLVMEVDLQLNPPRMPELGIITDSSDWNEVSSMLQPVPSGKMVAAVQKNQKVGDYIVLGKVSNIKPLVPEKTDEVISSATWKSKAKGVWGGASSSARSAFGTYLSTSGARALNSALRKGNIETTHSGKKISQYVNDMGELMIDVPEGSTFVRNMGEKGYGATPSPAAIKDLQQFLLTAESGTVVQEPGFSSTSWTGGNKVLSNNDIQWTFTAAKGVKMFPAWLSANSGEGEGLLPPNQRYMIVSAKKVGKTVKVEAILMPTI